MLTQLIAFTYIGKTIQDVAKCQLDFKPVDRKHENLQITPMYIVNIIIQDIDEQTTTQK